MLAAGFSAATAAAAATDWKTTTSLTVRESYDSNVYLQNTSPDPSCLGAEKPEQRSMVTTAVLSLGVEGRLSPALGLTASYAPEATVFHSESGENHAVHRLGLTLNGSAADAPWTVVTSACWIDGDDDGPIYGGPGGATGMGGFPLRDRRDAFVGRSSVKWTRSTGQWLVRPLASVYLHDFYTRQTRQPGYMNYIDRRELLAGVDFGRSLAPKTWLIVGVRAGRQDQFKLHGVDSPYDSTLQRVVAGVEGTLLPGLQVTVLAGPETRRFETGTARGFDRHPTLLWFDAAATVTLSPRDTCVLTARRFEQPAFAGLTVYEDITYEISWRRRVNPRIATALGFKAYGGEWPAPTVREDWIFTPSGSVQVALTPRAGLEFAYAYDRADSCVPATPGREYSRHVASVSAKFTF